MKQRNEYFDFLRGIAIIFVVGIHTLHFNENDSPIEIDIKNIVYQSLLCAVPIFLAISSFFLSKINFSKNGSKLHFWRKQIPKIYIPCLIWSLPMLLKGYFYNNYPLINCLAFYFMCGLGVFYFISVIIQLYLLLPYIKTFCNISGVLFFSFISMISVFIINVIPFNNVMLSLGVSTLWIGFFALGIYLSKNSSREYNLSFAILLLLCGFFINRVEVCWWESTIGRYQDYRLGSFLYSFGAILLLFSKKVENIYHKNKSIAKYCLVYVGKISFGIYLIHYLLIPFLQFRGWGANWIMTLLTSILIIVIAKSLFPSFAKKYLGFY